MKKLLFIGFAAISMLVASCGSSENKKAETNTETPTEHAGLTAENANYVCPMNCKDGFSDKPGQCPTCGMDLVLVEKKTDGQGTEDNSTTDSTAQKTQ
jgi:hypothetical protein